MSSYTLISSGATLSTVPIVRDEILEIGEVMPRPPRLYGRKVPSPGFEAIRSGGL